MKCKKCEAEIQGNCMYCSFCGNEVQLVPEYNLLDEDMLSDIIQNETTGTLHTDIFEPMKTVSKLSRKCIWILICIVISIGGISTYFLYKNTKIKQWNSYDYQCKQAESYLNKEEYPSAISHFNRALELQPKDRAVRKQLLEIYLLTKKDKEAILILKEFILEDKADRESCQKLIEIYDRNKDYKAILELCEEVKASHMMDLFADYLVEQPNFSSISGTYHKPMEITISSKKGFEIYYTTDGRNPVEYGKLYEKPISLKEEATTELTAVTKNHKDVYSEPVKATYTIEYTPPEMPSVMPAGGTYTEPQKVTIEVPADCIAYYTWDGSDPTEASSIYNGVMEMPLGNQVLSVMLVNSMGLKSNIYRVNYVFIP